jgi:hypothetical protein
MTTAAMSGAGLMLCRSFPIAIPTGTGGTATVIAPGGYTIRCSVATWMKIGTASDGVATVPTTVVAGGTQPAVNRTVYIPADSDVPFDVPSLPTGSIYFSLIGASSTGNAFVNGPFSQTPGA